MLVVALSVVAALIDSAAAQELAITGTWVPQEMTADVLAHQPQNVRVLTVREARGGLIGKLIVPGLAGIPVAVEQNGDRIRLVIQIARGMETPFDATLTPDHLSVTSLGSGNPPTMLRRPSPEEGQVLERMTPAPLDLAPQQALMSYLGAAGSWTGSGDQLNTRAAGIARLLIGSAEYQLV